MNYKAIHQSFTNFINMQPHKPIIDKSILSEYIATRINHDHNPQLFESQLESQIAKTLPRYEQNYLKDLRRKMLLKKMSENEQRERQILKQKLTSKMSQSIKRREKQIKEKNDLRTRERKIKQEIIQQKLKNSRIEALQDSLKKIKKFEEERANPKIKLSQSLSTISKKDQIESHLKKKQEKDQYDYNQKYHKLSEKKIFQQEHPRLQQMSALYAQKAHSHKHIQDQKQSELINKLGESMQKIEEARKKKEKNLDDRRKKLKIAQEYEQLQRKAKRQQLAQAEKKRINQMKIKDGQKTKLILASKSSHALNTRRHLHSAQKESQNFTESPEIHKSSTFKHEIHKHLVSYLKNSLQA